MKMGSYHLEAKSLNGEKFLKSRNLQMNSKQYSTFVQTDKSMYKGSDVVKFRVLILDRDTKPYAASSVEIYITDGDRNRVKQFSKPKFTKGVFQGELQLSDSPVLGEWTIHIKVKSDEEITKTFDVAEYVLPKFEVIIDSKPRVAFKEGKIKVMVSAKYTFGKLAVGNVTVTAELEDVWRWPVSPTIKVSKTVADFNAKSFVEFDIKNELRQNEIIYDKRVIVIATFTDQLTGRSQNAVTSVTITKEPFDISFQQNNRQTKPGIPYEATVFVKTVDGVPITDLKNAATIEVTYNFEYFEKVNSSTTTTQAPSASFGFGGRPWIDWNPVKYYEEKKTLKAFIRNGFATILIDVPLSTNFTSLTLVANYSSSSSEQFWTSNRPTESNQYIRAKLLTEK